MEELGLELRAVLQGLAKCPVINFKDVPNAPIYTYGHGFGNTQQEACGNAEKEARQLTPVGTRTRHCSCRCTKR